MSKWYYGDSCVVNLGAKGSTVANLADDIDRLATSKPLIKVREKIKEEKEVKKRKKGLSIDLGDTLIAGGEKREVIIDETDDSVLDYMKLVGLDTGEEDEDEFEEILREQRGLRDEFKKKDDIKKEFADNLALLYNLLESSKTFEKKIEKTYDAMGIGTTKRGRVEGISKYAIEMGTNVIQSRKATLDIIKEINTLKKNIIDLQTKADTKKATSIEAQNTDVMTSGFINNIMNTYGRGNIIEQIRGAANVRRNTEQSSYGHYAGEDASDIDSIIDDISSVRGMSNDQYDDIMGKIENRLDTEDNPFRSEEATRYIEFEKLEPKIIVKKCLDDGEWKFIAVSKDNQEIYGYPVPSKGSAGKMTFTADNTYATDSKGRAYKVIPFFKAR